nr:ElyC/SanA/YdcF family protein [Winogradskyella wandonensis]
MKYIISLGVLFGLLCLSIPNYIVAKTAENKTFYNIKDIPKNKVGLVLGANKYTSNGNISLYYLYRVDATAKLFQANKIEYVLVSGDNSRKNYNEPSMFKEDLVKRGIPENKIFLDYAGFRTLDSVVRAKEIFGQHSITIISQRFHCQRAIFLANAHDIKAVGFNAKHYKRAQFFNKPSREYLARAKAVLDVLTDKKPKYLGNPIAIR